MKIEDVRSVLIVGAGTMGQQIGLQCAMHGYDMMLYDISMTSLRRRWKPQRPRYELFGEDFWLHVALHRHILLFPLSHSGRNSIAPQG